MIGMCLCFFVLKIKLNAYPHESYSFMRVRSERRKELAHDNDSKCDPRKKVAFLKTHKTAGTTIQNILLRFGRDNDLNFVLSANGQILSFNHPFSRSMIQGTPWENAGLEYDMFLQHAIWNYREIAATLSDHKDVFYFSIIRDPVEQFRSWWDYTGLSKKYKTSLDAYAANVVKDSSKPYRKRPSGFNQMLYDFGLPYKDMHDKAKVENKIKAIDKEFNLIILSDNDYFNDSVILLKQALCWEYKHMVNFKLNARNDKTITRISAITYQNLKGNLLSVDIV